MRRAALAAPLLALALALATPVRAQEPGGAPIPYAAPGAWTVAIDPTLGRGCFAMRVWPDGLVLRLGFAPSREASYLFVANDRWPAPETRAGLTLAPDAAGPYRYDARAVDLSGTRALAAGPLSDDLLDALSRAYALAVAVEGGPSAEVSLAGSARALDALIACQRETTGAAEFGGDPFG
ncbi:MAG: hypothetical protein ACFBWO_16795 [Paracoccaceae bacterium]